MASAGGLVVGIASLVIGALAIRVAARLVVGTDQGFGNAVVAAAVGAVVYGLFSFLGVIPLVGPFLLLVLWVAVINWRYPGGWLDAAGIGVVAWLVAMVILYVLGMVGIVEFSALGVPGA